MMSVRFVAMLSSWSEIRQIVKHLTFLRCINIVQVWWSYRLSRIWSKSQPMAPISVSIEPTTACNLGCPECPSGLKMFERPTGNAQQEHVASWLDQLAQLTMYVNFYFQGEPFIHPGFLRMVNHAHKLGMYTSTSTNAHFLHDDLAKKTVESGLDRLIVSIDGLTQEVYEQYRIHGQLAKVIDGTRRVIQWKRELGSATPMVVFQFLVVAHNEHQIADVIALAEEIGVDEVRFKTAQVYDYEHGHSLIPKNEKYSRYVRQKDGTYRVKNSLSNHCWRMWSGSVLTWDGRVVPCCFDKDATHALGDLKLSKFKDIWNGHSYKNFRSSVMAGRADIDICANCSEGTKVWAAQE
jgi:radical SAM protein with 4Fe4S-binding SPASM domain